MRYFPLFLDLEGRRVVIVGAGEAAAQKFRLLERMRARLELAAPGDAVSGELAEAVRSGRVAHVAPPSGPADLAGAALVVVSTGTAVDDARIAAMGRAAGAVVNVVDRPELCDAITPAIVDRDPLVVAIGTEGTAPVLARKVRAAIETLLPPDLGELAALAGELRAEVEAELAPERRRAFWAWAFGGPPRQLWEAGARREAEVLMRRALRGEGEELPWAARPVGGSAALLVAPASPDLITLRALRRLQEADLVLHEGPATAGIVELARRDAARQGLEPPAAETPPDGPAAAVLIGQIADRLIEAAAEGRHAVLVTASRSRATAVEAVLSGRGLAPERLDAGDAG